MATSGVTTFNLNKGEIISGALRLVGGISLGEPPTTDQTNEASDALNAMVKSMMGLGMPLWAVKNYTMTMTANTASYNIGVGQTINTPKPLKIYQAYISRTASNQDTPVQLISRQEYFQLGNKTSTGTPVQLFYQPYNNYGTLYIYPVPDAYTAANMTLKLIYQRPFEDFVASSDEPDFPQEWVEVLKYGLAVRLAPEYGLDIPSRKELKQEYNQLLNLAQSFNQEEVSLYMQPDPLTMSAYRGN